MSEAERAEYEEKKLKLRKAMGENLHDDVEGEDMDSKARRLALLQVGHCSHPLCLFFRPLVALRTDCGRRREGEVPGLVVAV